MLSPLYGQVCLWMLKKFSRINKQIESYPLYGVYKMLTKNKSLKSNLLYNKEEKNKKKKLSFNGLKIWQLKLIDI